ncbi:hypothetical protein [Candidatus Nitrosocosmicus hydrocola]|uniref:hypothetical protein n=1 Tax=Candidatus Nitrosocosmicus hydrocola TaxID=1826872 RepID=UPI0013730C28|nr:hypothetical protein [Candidatus Nitrosocosmicus hydrocola]
MKTLLSMVKYFVSQFSMIVMSYVREDKNYTDPTHSGVDSSVNRVGDLTNEPPTNEATNKITASKLANLLEDLKFPARKEEILDHINKKSPSMGNRINDVFESIQNNLEDGIEYENTYQVGLASKLVEIKKV